MVDPKNIVNTLRAIADDLIDQAERRPARSLSAEALRGAAASIFDAIAHIIDEDTRGPKN